MEHVALISMGEVLSRQKRYKEAIYYFETALSENKEDKTLIFSYAQVLFFSGDYDRAEKILKEIIVNEPQNVEAKIYLADIRAYTKRFEEAISLYTAVLRERDSPEIKMKMADVMSWDKQYGRALRLYDDVLAEKEDKKTRLQKARVLGWDRKYSESIKDIGGQTAWSGDIENYTGYQFVTGPELTAKFEEHMRKYNIELKEGEDVIGLEKKGDIISIKTKKGIYQSKTAIIASGKRSKELGVPGEAEFKNRGLTYCATCDGPLFSGKDVAVIGGGNSAMDAVLQLINIANHVYVINIFFA